jgi:hypothetical protein
MLMKLHIYRLLIFVVITFPEISSAQSATGQISGIIQDPTGKPLAGAIVAVSAQPMSPPVVFWVTTVAASNGSFQVSGVPAGSFTICPAVQSSSLLPSCLWGAPTTVTLTAGQNVSVPPIKLVQGYQLQFKVIDPAGKINAASAAKKPVGVLISVRSNTSAFQSVPATRADPSGFAYQITVPFDTPLTILMGCHNVDMADPNGYNVPRSDGAYAGASPNYIPITVTVPNGKTVPPIVYTVVNAGAQ